MFGGALPGLLGTLEREFLAWFLSIINATGLHARPASVFVTEAKKYQSNVTIKNVDKDSAPVNAKSIMMILAAGLGTGTKVEVACDGADEQEALDALVALIESGFGE